MARQMYHPSVVPPNRLRAKSNSKIFIAIVQFKLHEGEPLIILLIVIVCLLCVFCGEKSDFQKRAVID
jgi:hypothetical protein